MVMMVPTARITIATLTMSQAIVLQATVTHQHMEMTTMIQKNQAMKRGKEPRELTPKLPEHAKQNANIQGHPNKNLKKNQGLKNITEKTEMSKKQLRHLKKKNMRMIKTRNLMRVLKNQKQDVNITERKKMNKNLKKKIK